MKIRSGLLALFLTSQAQAVPQPDGSEYKRSDTQMLSNQINALKRELVEQIKQLDPNSKQAEPSAQSAEPIDLPDFLAHKAGSQLN
jgi:hypothetical protein